MTKKCCVFLLTFLFLFFLVPYSGTNTLTIATSSWPPYEYASNNGIIGFHAEIIRKVFRKMGIHVQITLYPWQRVVYMAKNKNVDAIFSLRITKEREKYLIFPKEPLGISQNVFFYRKNSKKKYKFNSLKDLKGLRIGVSRGYSFGDEFMKSNLFEKDVSTNEIRNFKKLIYERDDLFICDKIVGIHILRQLNALDKIKYLPKPLSTFKLYLAFTKKKEYEKLAERFSIELRRFKKTKEYQKIREKYFYY